MNNFSKFAGAMKKKAPYGGDRFNKGGFNGGNDFNKGKFEGGDNDIEEKKPPFMGMGEGKGENEETIEDETKETKEENPKDEKIESETIEEIIDLYDQLTPLIDKLRNIKK